MLRDLFERSQCANVVSAKSYGRIVLRPGESFDGVAVFSGSTVQARGRVGDAVTEWMARHPELAIVEIDVVQSSARTGFHCISIVVFSCQRRSGAARRKRPSTRVTTRRVLVIDDHAASRLATCVAFRTRGHVSKPASTALAALEAVETFQPDIVLLEWNLRGGAGLGLAAQLRRAAQERELVIIAVSTQAEPEGFCRDEGFDAYFVKPVSVDAVLDACARVLNTT